MPQLLPVANSVSASTQNTTTGSVAAVRVSRQAPIAQATKPSSSFMRAKAKATTADLQGIDSGVYSASVLARMQDSPADDLFFYVPSGKTWGFFDGSQLNPNGLAFKAFKMMAAKGEATRVDVPSFPERGRYLLASKHGGKGWVMLCNFKRSDDAVLRLKGATPVSVLRLDDVCRLEEVRDDWRWDAAPCNLLLKAPLASTSAMWLVECNLD